MCVCACVRVCEYISGVGQATAAVKSSAVAMETSTSNESSSDAVAMTTEEKQEQ